MPRRRPRKPFPQRVASSIESMIPGTVGGRVANASPFVHRSVEATRNPTPSPYLPPPPPLSYALGLYIDDAQSAGRDPRLYSFPDLGNTGEFGRNVTFIGYDSGAGTVAINEIFFQNFYDADDPAAKTANYNVRFAALDPLTGEVALGSVGLGTARTVAPEAFDYVTGAMTTWDTVDSAFTNTSGELRLTAAPGHYIFTVDLDIWWT